MRFGSTAKVLLKCKLKYYKISECTGPCPYRGTQLVPCAPPPPPSSLALALLQHLGRVCYLEAGWNLILAAADVMFLGTSSFMLTTSADKTARLWASESDGGAGPYTVGGVLTDHTGEITCASLHPTRKYFATASLDRTWAFYDVENALCYTQVGIHHLPPGQMDCLAAVENLSGPPRWALSTLHYVPCTPQASYGVQACNGSMGGVTVCRHAGYRWRVRNTLRVCSACLCSCGASLLSAS